MNSSQQGGSGRAFWAFDIAGSEWCSTFRFRNPAGFRWIFLESRHKGRTQPVLRAVPRRDHTMKDGPCTLTRRLIDKAISDKNEDQLIQILSICTLKKQDLELLYCSPNNVFVSIGKAFEYRDSPMLGFINALSAEVQSIVFYSEMSGETPFADLVNRCSPAVIRRFIAYVSNWDCVVTDWNCTGSPVERCAAVASSYERFLLFAPLWSPPHALVCPPSKIFFLAVLNPSEAVAKAIIQWALDTGLDRAVLWDEMHLFDDCTPAIFAMARGKNSLVSLLTPPPRPTLQPS